MAKASLFVILARKARIGVIFRRGPSKQVLLVKWNLADDSFEMGQWFKGRIYERHCDLSPSGKLLVYFAAKHHRRMAAWTAVSRPPFLTALALWPKQLFPIGGGGLFETDQTLLLDHLPYEFDLGQGFDLDDRLKLRPLNADDMRQADTIHHQRLRRDGWVVLHRTDDTHRYDQKPIPNDVKFMRVYEKRMARKGRELRLQMWVGGTGDYQGDWQVLSHEVLDEHGVAQLQLQRADWADWDRNGDVLYAVGRKLFRLPWRGLLAREVGATRELADFSALRFALVETPSDALRWPRRNR